MKAIVTTININAFEAFDTQKELYNYNNKGDNSSVYIYFDSDIICNEESNFLNSLKIILQKYTRTIIMERNLFLMENEINHLITEFIHKDELFSEFHYRITKKQYILHKEPYFEELKNANRVIRNSINLTL